MAPDNRRKPLSIVVSLFSAVIPSLFRPYLVSIKGRGARTGEQSVTGSAPAAKQSDDQRSGAGSDTYVYQIAVTAVKTRALSAVIRGRLIRDAVVISTFVISAVVVPTLIVSIIRVAVVCRAGSVAADPAALSVRQYRQCDGKYK